MGGIFRRSKTLTELEEEREHEEAEVSVLHQKVLKSRLQGRLGRGATKYFKDD
ncbi:hypothetical protein LCGC14_1820680, partial [marine sediment metagenome]